MEIKCAYSSLVDIDKIKLNERNRNIHTKEQIDRLTELMGYYGIRHPLILDHDYVCRAGEGRFLAMKQAGLKQVPCDFQEFLSDDQAQQFSIADNEIARWASPDLAGINVDIQDWGPEFDLELLGMEGFTVEPFDSEIREKELNENIETEKECPSCGYRW